MDDFKSDKRKKHSSRIRWKAKKSQRIEQQPKNIKNEKTKKNEKKGGLLRFLLNLRQTKNIFHPFKQNQTLVFSIKGGDPTTASATVALLRLNPPYQIHLRRIPPIKVGTATSGKIDSDGLTGGVYKARERIHRGMLIRDY